MSRFNLIEQKIKSLGPGAYQRLCSDYSYKKYKLSNMTDLGGKEGTDKTTKGVPDSYSVNDNGKYIFFMYGTVEKNSSQKVRDDINDAHNIDKTGIKIEDVDKIVCFHTNTNMRAGTKKNLINLYDDVKIELIDLDSMSHDLCDKYQSIALDHLGISIDSGQISDIETFVQRYDNISVQSPLNIPFIEREEKNKIIDYLNNKDNRIIILTGNSGVGKTRLAIEVCREFLKNHKRYICYCIRNNGNELYEDLKISLSDNDQNYILLIDDINETKSLRTILDYINLYNNGEIKIIATIRDYALKHTMNQINQVIKNQKVFYMSCMNKIELSGLLDKIGISGKIKKNKIINISNCNPRIAVMCANYLKNNKIYTFNDVISVFKEFYDKVIDDNEISENQQKILFYLSFLGPLRIDNEDTKKILEELDIFNIEEYKKLHNQELIDFYENKAIKMNDQSFANYILYKYLIENKMISISKLLKDCYPKLIQKFISCISIIYKLFSSKETVNYISYEIKSVWNESPFCSDLTFFEAFYNVDRLKSLTLIKKEIDEEKNQEYDDKYFVENKDYRPTNTIVSILSSFKDGEYEEEAVDLLFDYFEKKPSIYNELLYVIDNNFCININSVGRNYEFEYMFINKILNRINNKIYAKIYEKILFKTISSYLLLTHSFTTMGPTPFTIEYSTITMPENKDYFKFRIFLFKTLLKNKNKSNCNLIYDIILERSVYLYEISSSTLIENDIKELDEDLFFNIDNPSFYEAHIMYELKKEYDKNNFMFQTYVNNYKKNIEYQLINPLIYDVISEEEAKRVVKEYTLNDYKDLFSALRKFELKRIKINECNIQESLRNILKYSCSRNDFKDIFAYYIKFGYPFSFYTDIFERIDDIELLDSLKDVLFDDKTSNAFMYLRTILERDRMISKENLPIVKDFINYQNKNEKKYSLSIDTIIKYKKIDKRILEYYSNSVLKNNIIIGCYIVHHKNDSLKEVVSSFDNIDLLETLYLKGLNDPFDYDGAYGTELIKRNNNYFIKLIDNIDNFSNYTGKLKNIVSNVWLFDNCLELVLKAYEELSKKPFGYLRIHELFNYNSNEAYENQQIFLNKYIENNYLNEKKMHVVFSVINQYYPEKKREYILKLIDLNTDIEIFKRTVTSFQMESWSGSRIPLIEKKKEYIIDLKDNIPNKLDFLYHKQFLSSLIDSYDAEIKEEQLQEYINDFFK